jgi:quinolinate synthase
MTGGFAMTRLETSTGAKAARQAQSAAERFGVIERPELKYTPAVARETAHLYDRVRDHIPEIEWPVYAPYVPPSTASRKKRGAAILAHNYQTPDIFHCVADIVGDSLQLAREATLVDERDHHPVRRPLHGRDLEASEHGQDRADP